MTSQATDRRSGAFRAIATIIDSLESTGREVRDVTLRSENVFSEDILTVEFKVTLPEVSNIARMGLMPMGDQLLVTDDGTCMLEFNVEIPLNESFRSSAPGIESSSDVVGPFEISEQLEGVLSPPDTKPNQVSINSEVQQPRHETDDVSEVSESEGSGSSSEKAYRDPEKLQTVYDEYETFEEMRDALGVDVTPQTVRRHMIKHGIHEVSSNPILEALRKHSMEQRDSMRNRSLSAGDSKADQKNSSKGTPPRKLADLSEYTPVAEYDEFELPPDISITDVKEAVMVSRTLYEVENKLGISREEARNILRDLNLLELVVGRVATSDLRDFSEVDVDSRIIDALGAEDMLR